MCDFDDFFGDDFGDLEDFAVLGGIYGYAEEECREQRRLEREFEKDENPIPDCCDPPDDDPPYP